MIVKLIYGTRLLPLYLDDQHREIKLVKRFDKSYCWCSILHTFQEIARYVIESQHFRIDPVKMKLSRPMMDDSIQLGPGGRPGSFGSWGRGSSGSEGKTASQENDRQAGNPTNRYDTLIPSSL